MDVQVRFAFSYLNQYTSHDRRSPHNILSRPSIMPLKFVGDHEACSATSHQSTFRSQGLYQKTFRVIKTDGY